MQAILQLTISIICFSSLCVHAGTPFALTGSATNTTDPDNPKSASVLLTFDDQGECVVRVAPPLMGSGQCAIAHQDDETETVEIVSMGPLTKITWSGEISSVGVFGKYVAEYPELPHLPEHGVFEFVLIKNPDQTLKVSDVLAADLVEVGPEEEQYIVFMEQNLLSIHHRDGSYAGRRVFLSKDGTPETIVDDAEGYSAFRSYGSEETILEWFRSGDTGYYVHRTEDVSEYLDHSMKETGWFSVTTDASEVFVYAHGNQHLELFDDSLSPLGIHGYVATSGREYWTREIGKLTEYLDASFRPLGWFSADRNGEVYFLQVQGETVRAFDSNLDEVSFQELSENWAELRRLVPAEPARDALSLGSPSLSSRRELRERVRSFENARESSQGQARSSAAPSYQEAPSSAYSGESSTVLDQSSGDSLVSKTRDVNSLLSSAHAESIGGTDLRARFSNEGQWVGVRHRLGAFDLTTFVSRSEVWRGRTVDLGNIKYHKFYSPDGRSISGTSIRVGDFILNRFRAR